MKTLYVTATLVGLFLVFPIAAQQLKPPVTPKDTGRFQIVAQSSTNEVFGNVYLVDTETGRTWRQIRLSDADGDDNGTAGEPEVWLVMTRLDSAAELGAFELRHPKPETKP